MKKNKNWLNIAEYVLLIGSGVGSVATIVSQQIAFTAAPMSALFLLNLVNRRRIEESGLENTATSVSHLDRKLSGDISSLQQQVQVLPNYLDLASLRKTLTRQQQEALEPVSREIAQLKQELSKPEWRLLRQEVAHLQGQVNNLSDSVAQVTSALNSLSRFSSTSGLEGFEQELAQLKSDLSQVRINLHSLIEEQTSVNPRVLQDQINHLNRRLNMLPTPFDASSLKQDVESLLKVVGELASRRDLARVEGQVEKLSQQNAYLEQSLTPLKVATGILRKQVETVNAKINANEHVSDQLLQAALQRSGSSVLDELRTSVTALEQRLNQLPASPDLSQVRTEVQELVSSHLGPLQQQLASIQQYSQVLDRQHKSLRDWVNRLPQVMDTAALQNQVKYLTAQVEWATGQGMDVKAEVEAAVNARLEQLGEVGSSAKGSSPQYELVFDVKNVRPFQDTAIHACASRTLLEKALQEAEARLIVVYPHPQPETLDEAMIQQFRDFLDRNGCLDIGWGHLGDVSKSRVPRSLDRRRRLDSTGDGFLYGILNQLTELKKQYPDQFRFKVLGTDENFLVCDRSFAILGAQSLPTASVLFPQAAVGLRTTDSEVIQGLVDRFDDPVLDETDANAYFNRATTRYDLGDRQGAIADYGEVLRINANDDIAHNNRGVVRYDLGDREGAMADFSLAIQLNPNNFVAFFNRGFIRAEMGDKLGAIEDYTCALQSNPDYTPAYFYRGLTRTRMQNKLGAVEDYSEVIRLNPHDANAYFYRGLALIKLGHRLDALKDLRHAAQLCLEQGDSTGYEQAVQTLKKLHKSLVIESPEPALASNSL